MLKKFISVKNIGVIQNYSHTGGEYRKFHVFYGENGSGKSTLVSILRSLKLNNQDFLIGRKTLGIAEEQQVLLLVENQQFKFNQNGWDNTSDKFEIFDSHFVNENIYSGYYVDTEHKRKLQNFVIGEEGVKLTKKIFEIDELSRELANQIRMKEAEIKNKIINRFDFSLFLELENQVDLDSKIAEIVANLKNLENQEIIKNTNTLTEIILPNLNVDLLKTTFDKNFDDIAQEAEDAILQHVENKLDDEGTKWIQSGLNYMEGDECPFCTQDTSQIKIVQFYKQYFSETYKAFIDDVKDNTEGSLKPITSINTAKINEISEGNKSLMEIWNSSLQEKSILPTDFTSAIIQTIEKLVVELEKNIDTKYKAIHKSIELSDELLKIIEEYNTHQAILRDYNSEVKIINGKIQTLKSSIGQIDKNAEMKKLDIFNNIKSRFNEEVDAFVIAYKKLLRDKFDLATSKEEKKTELNELNETILSSLAEPINQILRNCAAGFKIGQISQHFPAGRASVKYNLMINNVPFEIGDANTPDNLTSFKNTLSEGDKSTLAFAFFITKILSDPDISNKVVIVDDPISSFDLHRKEMTVFYLNKILSSCKQLILLSHDPEFTKLYWEKVNESNKGCHKVKKTNNGTVLVEFDMREFNIGDYFHNYMVLKEYFSESKGDPTNVARTIRPLLEANLKFRFPTSFAIPGKWLGDFLTMIDNSNITHEYNILKGEQYDALDILNEYSKKYHHDTNSIGYLNELSNINEAQLKTFVESAINFCTG